MSSTETSIQEQTRDGSTPARQTPLPWRKLAVLFAVQLTEPMGNTIILPFMYEMVGGFDIVRDPKDIAFYAGILFTSFHFLRIPTVTYWGSISDRIGRRPVMLFGLLGYLLTYALFGVSKSFAWAVTIRCLNGFFTAGNVVIRPMIAEISDDTNRVRMLSMFPLLWHVGTMLGGAVGGLTVDPVKNYPWLFGDSILFREYPYLFPCLVNSAISLFGLGVGFFYLEETLAIKPTTALTKDAASETTPLVSEVQREEGGCDNNAMLEPLSIRDILTPTVIRLLATNVGLCLAISMHNQLYPIFAATDIADGGLGMDARTIGFTLMLCSMLVVYLQLVVYHKDERKHGTLVCYRRGFLWLTVFGTTLPLFSALAKYMGNSTRILASFNVFGQLSGGNCLFWGLLFVELYIRMYGDTLAFTGIYILIINVAPRKNCLGFLNGLQQQTNSVMFIIGPIISGSLWSWSIKNSFPYPFNSHFAWVFSCVWLLTAWYISQGIPDSVNAFASESSEQSRANSNDEPNNTGPADLN